MSKRAKGKGQSEAGWFYGPTGFGSTSGGFHAPRPEPTRPERCADCGAEGERTGHQTCQYPQDHR